jgi:hypothetical protein
MPLYERLTRLGISQAETKIPVHQFMSAIAELKRGKCSQADIVALYNLNATEQTELTALLGRIIQRFEAVSYGAFVTITNAGTAYDFNNQQRGLGFTEIDMTGVTSIDLTVQCNKIGTGTQSWQLWNETDGAQVCVIDDAGATGEHRRPGVVRHEFTDQSTEYPHGPRAARCLDVGRGA